MKVLASDERRSEDGNDFGMDCDEDRVKRMPLENGIDCNDVDFEACEKLPLREVITNGFSSPPKGIINTSTEDAIKVKSSDVNRLLREPMTNGCSSQREGAVTENGVKEKSGFSSPARSSNSETDEIKLVFSDGEEETKTVDGSVSNGANESPAHENEDGGDIRCVEPMEVDDIDSVTSEADAAQLKIHSPLDSNLCHENKSALAAVKENASSASAENDSLPAVTESDKLDDSGKIDETIDILECKKNKGQSDKLELGLIETSDDKIDLVYIEKTNKHSDVLDSEVAERVNINLDLLESDTDPTELLDAKKTNQQPVLDFQISETNESNLDLLESETSDSQSGMLELGISETKRDQSDLLNDENDPGLSDSELVESTENVSELDEDCLLNSEGDEIMEEESENPEPKLINSKYSNIKLLQTESKDLKTNEKATATDSCINEDETIDSETSELSKVSDELSETLPSQGLVLTNFINTVTIDDTNCEESAFLDDSVDISSPSNQENVENIIKNLEDEENSDSSLDREMAATVEKMECEQAETVSDQSSLPISNNHGDRNITIIDTILTQTESDTAKSKESDCKIKVDGKAVVIQPTTPSKDDIDEKPKLNQHSMSKETTAELNYTASNVPELMKTVYSENNLDVPEPMDTEDNVPQDANNIKDCENVTAIRQQVVDSKLSQRESGSPAIDKQENGVSKRSLDEEVGRKEGATKKMKLDVSSSKPSSPTPQCDNSIIATIDPQSALKTNISPSIRIKDLEKEPIIDERIMNSGKDPINDERVKNSEKKPIIDERIKNLEKEPIIDEKNKSSADITKDYLKKFTKEDLNIFQSVKKMTRKELEQLVLRKTLEAIAVRGTIAVREQELISMQDKVADYKKKMQPLNKQVHDLGNVIVRLEQALKKNPKPVRPLKVTRSVGLQVSFSSLSGMTPKMSANAAPARQGQVRTLRPVNRTPAPPAPQQPKPPVQNIMQPPEPQKTLRVSLPGSNMRILSPAMPAKSSPSIVQPRTTTAQPRTTTAPPAVARIGAAMHTIAPMLTSALQSTTPVPNTAVVAPRSQNSRYVDLTDVEDRTGAGARAHQYNLTQMQSGGRISLVPPQGISKQGATPVAYLLQSPQSRPVLLTPSGQAAGRGINPLSLNTVQWVKNMPPGAGGNQPSNMMQRQIGTATGIRTSQVMVRPTAQGMPLQRGSLYTVGPTVASFQRGPTGYVPSRVLVQHPAPLPPIPSHPAARPGWKLPPPKPVLKISKVPNGIVLSWNMSVLGDFEDMKSYQIYAYQESKDPPSSSLWKTVGDVKALALPMACTLTQFKEGHKYHFSVRAVDIHSRMGPHSDPTSIMLLKN